ncbi:MAG: acetyl-CoA carboxylase biotin carboxyl carrier protein subunit, partial [Desulfobacterales bacterium]
AAEAKEAKAPAAAPAAAVEGTPLTAPMPGMIVSYKKQEGDSVNEGETVVILEAMKMENALPSPASGTVKSLNFSSGDSVAKGDVLAVIG